jgi:iron complex transport system substrate-binding protein
VSLARVVFLLLCLFQISCEAENSGNALAPVQSGAHPRIVTLAPHLTELVFAAGAGADIVGVVRYSDFPAVAQDIPLIGDAIRVDYERVVELAPDLILSWKSGTPDEVSRYLRGIGFRVLELESQRLIDIPAQIEQLGDLAGTADVANATAANLRAQLGKLRDQNSGLAPVSVFLQISASPFFTVTAKHILNDAIELCGGRNIFAELDGLAPMVSLEAVIDANPAAILVVIPDPDAPWQDMWSAWSQLDAVAGGHVYSVDADLVSRAGPRMIDGAAQICSALAGARDSQSALLR